MQINISDGDRWIINCNKTVEIGEDGTKVIKWTLRGMFIRAPAAQRQMRKKISFGPTFFHLAQTFGAYFFRRHFYFFLCYKRYELRKRQMTPNKQCRWRVFLNWWWPLVIIGYKVRPIIDTYLVDWTWFYLINQESNYIIELADCQ